LKDLSDGNMAACTVCKTTLKNPNREGLLRHRNSAKHKKNFTAKAKMLMFLSLSKRQQ